jgi:hypothetical protein
MTEARTVKKKEVTKIDPTKKKKKKCIREDDVVNPELVGEEPTRSNTEVPGPDLWWRPVCQLEQARWGIRRLLFSRPGVI